MNWPASSTTSISQRASVLRAPSAASLVSDVMVMIPACGLARGAGESLRMMVLPVPCWPGDPGMPGPHFPRAGMSGPAAMVVLVRRTNGSFVVAYESKQASSKQAPSERRREELGKFLRVRRGRLTPEDFGMPAGPRRRTPGLRREEVALLAGVGVTWYTWLEQGRQINASTQVLDAVARTLRLDHAERQHLYWLAEAAPLLTGTARCAVPEAVREIVRSLD